ncbi:Serine acetyltransferase, partial [human gut metagenome]
MMQGLRDLWGKIQYNIKRVMDSDPAATSVWMVIWTYPHITALFWHFFAQSKFSIV